MPHSTRVMSLARRAGAIIAILTLSVGNLAMCAGWQATPEARMACCASGTSCPMHKSEHHAASPAPLNQAQADACCASASDRNERSAATTTSALGNSAALPAVSTVVVPVTTPALQQWRALVPLPGPPVPKHLLLSVLLV